TAKPYKMLCRQIHLLVTRKLYRWTAGIVRIGPMRTLASALLIIITVGLHAQQRHDPMHDIWDQALPYITNFTSQDYKASLQNWSITQDNNGIIYVGNSSGLLEYDGTRWRLIKTP